MTTAAEAAKMRAEFNRRPEALDVLHDQAKMFLENASPAVAYHLFARGVDMTNGESPKMLRGLAAAQFHLASTAGTEEFIDQAALAAEMALKLERGLESLLLYALSLLERGDLAGAEAYLREALTHEHRADVLMLLSTCLFARKAWDEAWDTYEAHLGFNQRIVPAFPPVPYWDGEPVDRLAVFGELGLGDEISFASFIPSLIASGLAKEITFYCDPRLENLFRWAFPEITVLSKPGVGLSFGSVALNVMPQFDAKCVVGSLGQHFRRSAADFPGTAYLEADPARVQHWRDWLQQFRPPYIGVAWTGGPVEGMWHRRSLDELSLESLVNGIDGTFISLEYRPWSSPLPIERPPLNPKDYADTAALVMALDEVVTVTTTMARLCGALGKRAHVLVPSLPRWFYAGEGQGHDWHHSLVLHRRPMHAQWPIGDVIEAVAQRATRGAVA